MSSRDGNPLGLAGPPWPGFIVRTVVLAGSSSLPYEESAWRDTLVVVLSGRLELETVGGARRTFGRGEILFFTGLGLRSLHNRGGEAVALQSISRRVSGPS